MDEKVNPQNAVSWRVSPNPRRSVPAEHAKRIKAAARKRDAGEAELRSAVIAALDIASVREVAEVAGLNPATVQRWSTQARRA